MVRSCMGVMLASLLGDAAAQDFGGGFGGGGFGGGGFGGGGGWNQQPAPRCQAFKCPKGQVAVGKAESKIMTYGCKESGMNVFSAGSFDPNDPLGGMQRNQKNLDPCCVARDVCKQTCGMTSVECHEAFQKCQNKICKGDQNCQLQGLLADMSGDPYYNPDDDRKDPDYKYDPERTKCEGYKNAQAAVCQCVEKDEVEAAHTAKLKHFYKEFNPEKLDEDGNIKDVEGVWKKWKGKEKDMFVALATKYKDKAVIRKEKPKPAPYTPPKKFDADEGSPDDYNADWKESEGDEVNLDGKKEQRKQRLQKMMQKNKNKGDEVNLDEKKEPERAPEPEKADPEEEAFEKRSAELNAQKDKAKADEDFDLAQELKEKLAALRAEEVTRLKAKKSDAVEAEDFGLAAKLKKRIAKLEL